MANKGYSLELDDESDAPKKNYSLEMDEAAPAANPQSENGGEQDPGILQSLAAGARDMIPAGQKVSAGLEAGFDKLTGTDRAPWSDIYKRVLTRNDNQLKAAEKYNPGATTVGQALGFGASLAAPVGGAAGAGIKGLLAAGVTGGLYGAVDAYGRSRANNEVDELKDTGLGLTTGALTGGTAHAIGEGVSRGYGAMQKALGRGEQGAKQAFVDATEKAASNAASQAPKASAVSAEVAPRATEESIATANKLGSGATKSEQAIPPTTNKFGSRGTESTQAIMAHQAGQSSGSLKQAQAVIAAHASGVPVEPRLLKMAQEVQAKAMGGAIPGAGEGAYSNLQRELSGDRTFIGQPAFAEEAPAIAESGGTMGGRPKNAGLPSKRSADDVEHEIAVHGLGDLKQYAQPGKAISAENLRSPEVADSHARQSLDELFLNSRVKDAQSSQYSPKPNYVGAAISGAQKGASAGAGLGAIGGIKGSMAGGLIGGVKGGILGLSGEALTNPASRLQAAKFANKALKSSDPVLKMVGESLKRTVRNESQNKVDEVMKSTDDPRRP